MRAVDLTVAALFFLAGAYLAVSSRLLPPGIGDLPGPGFFPLLIGLAMMLIAGLLAARTLPQSAAAAVRFQNVRTVLMVIGLTLLYLLLWAQGGFALRTVLFLLSVLRVFGEDWRRSAAVSLVLTAFVTLAFQLGLGLTLE